MSSPRLLLIDCDSTLSAIEGIDELARVCGPAVYREVEAMTEAAMNGAISVESVFGQRLEIIRPTAANVARVGELYLQTIEPTAVETIGALQRAGWTVVIISGGFRPAIEPLARRLSVRRIEAVDLYFDADTGEYRGYDAAYPTTRSGGKPEVVRRLKAELSPAKVVMVGDGVSDLETMPEVDLFVGFGRYAQRARVKAEAHAFIHSLAELPALLPRP